MFSILGVARFLLRARHSSEYNFIIGVMGMPRCGFRVLVLGRFDAAAAAERSDMVFLRCRGEELIGEASARYY